MALSAQDLLTNGGIPANSFVISNSKVMMDVGVFIGQNVSTLTDTVIPEVYLKFHMAALKAQVVYNLTRPTGQKIAVWFDPVSGSSQYMSDVSPAGYYSSWNLQANVLVPSNVDSVIAVYQ